MHSKLLFNVLLVGLLVQFAGCGPQRALWNEYDAAWKRASASGVNADPSESLRILHLIKKENPDAKHPKTGSTVDSKISLLEGIQGSQKTFERLEGSSQEFDSRMEGLNR